MKSSSSKTSAGSKKKKRSEQISDLKAAAELVRIICCMAGAFDLTNRAPDALKEAIRRRNTPGLYDWLVTEIGYQGISDRVALSYIRKHGAITWTQIASGLSRAPKCPKLENYWTFRECGYSKQSGKCSRPDLVHDCSLPKHQLRNGRLNQSAYSLYLFFRDIAGSQFFDWIELRLQIAKTTLVSAPGSLGGSLIAPMKNIYGVSDKILNMTLATLLIAGGDDNPDWRDAGIEMIAIDTLVHNLMIRTGIIAKLGVPHLYGVACYEVGGCADVLRSVTKHIDATEFNPVFPRYFPRFVQHAVWRWCAQDGLNVCNGNQIDDRERCRNIYCRVFGRCERRKLPGPKHSLKVE